MTQPDPGAQSGTTDPQSGVGTGQDGSTTDPATQSTGPQSGTDPATQGQPAVDPKEAEIANLRARMQAADKRAADREAELRQIKDKDLPAIDRLTRDNAELTKQLETLRTSNQSLQISNAFLADNTYDWHDPAAAQKLLDMEKVSVDESGNVTGLKVALKALADANPWMVKPKESDGADKVPPVGVPPVNGGGNGRNDGKASEQELKKRFPALRSRLG